VHQINRSKINYYLEGYSVEKLDLTKKLKHLFNPPKGEFTTVDVPAFNFIMTDGEGDPNTSQQFIDAVEVLYGVSYTLKFMVKEETGQDFKVMPLEGLWWSDDMSTFTTGNKDKWKWTLMILQPDFVTKKQFAEAVKKYNGKKKTDVSGKVRFEKYKEGMSAQIMYIGPYKDEGPTIAEMHKFINTNGGKLSGLHHEIYLSDTRKTAPEKLKTIIRQPFIR